MSPCSKLFHIVGFSSCLVTRNPINGDPTGKSSRVHITISHTSKLIVETFFFYGHEVNFYCFDFKSIFVLLISAYTSRKLRKTWNIRCHLWFLVNFFFGITSKICVTSDLMPGFFYYPITLHFQRFSLNWMRTMATTIMISFHRCKEWKMR